MLASKLLLAIRDQPAQNFFILTPDDEGMGLLIPKRLAKIIEAEVDVIMRDASTLNVEAARKLSTHCGSSPVGGSSHTHVILRRMQSISPLCVGPLLKIVEESPWARFIFVGTEVLPECQTLASRSVVAQLPFISEAATLGNLQGLKLDATTIQEKSLWDGTVGGSLQNLHQIGERSEILRALDEPTAVDLQGLVEHAAWDRLVGERMTPDEREFIKRDPTPERRQMVALLVVERNRA